MFQFKLDTTTFCNMKPSYFDYIIQNRYQKRLDKKLLNTVHASDEGIVHCVSSLRHAYTYVYTGTTGRLYTVVLYFNVQVIGLRLPAVPRAKGRWDYRALTNKSFWNIGSVGLHGRNK